jgi:Fe-S-cluster-containing dehydrogenase component
MKKYRKNIETDKSKQKDGEVEITPEESPLLGLITDNRNEMTASRRDFLKLCGYSFAVSALASCKSKITNALPYAIAPPEITPGDALYYASSYVNGNEYCSIIVKTRDGRPIKIEGNNRSGVTFGGTTARVQGSVLELYDGGRFHGPMKDGNPISWDVLDKEIADKLQKISDAKGTIVLLTPTIFSPSMEAVISAFLKKFSGSEWVQFDAISYSAILEANKESYGKQVIPDFRFDKADLIVSFGADFLGSWLLPVQYIEQFSSGRVPEKEMKYLIQLESNMSLTGCNADKRIQIKPSQEPLILLNIYKQLAKEVENRYIDVPASPVDVDEISQRLLKSKGKSIVISRSNVKEIQLLVNEINSLLGNIGHTILFDTYLRTHQALDNDMEMLVGKMNKGLVNAMLIWNVNPAFAYCNRDAFAEGLNKVDLKISLSATPDETNSLVQYICPDHHYLESWGDAEPGKDHFSLMQPTIDHIFDTRQPADSLLKWTGSGKGFYDVIKAYWIENMMPRQTEFSDPSVFFDNTLQRGVFEPSVRAENIENMGKKAGLPFTPASILDNGGSGANVTEIIFYEGVALGEGRQANNPWLQELPDPVTRICWDNYASVSPAQAKEFDLHDDDVINIGGTEIPVHIQPGQAFGTIGMALGYGRSVCGKVGDNVGTYVWKLMKQGKANRLYTAAFDNIIKTGKSYMLAQVQPHHSMEGRDFVREADLTEFRNDQAAGNAMHAYNVEHNKTLYKMRKYPHHHWGMAIDLSKCIGCGTCVIACQAENNVPVVGKVEVHRVHEMQWIRIDRYYTGADEDPEVVFQPVLCQHCQNAPCENVCPVAATNHSSEGLNQMIYNRCFGTRYCNNNCPYKVRRFNWFNFSDAGTLRGNLRDKEGMTSDLRRMVLNPDVTVRAQGVIEKCSFCAQRIQTVKLKAKYENRKINENEVKTACSQSCPANAIVFGDMNDENSELNRLINSGRRYNLLEELYTMPSVNYLTKIRNKIV